MAIQLETMELLTMLYPNYNCIGVRTMFGLEFFPGTDLGVLRRCGGLSGWRAPYLDFTVGARRPAFRIDENNQEISYLLVDMSEVELIGTDLTAAKLAGCNLYAAQLHSAILRRAQVQDSDLTQTNFEAADCNRADFRASHCLQTNFHQAQLGKANFTQTQCWLTDFSYADLRGTNFTQASFLHVNFVGARYNSATQWPVGFDLFLPDHGLVKE